MHANNKTIESFPVPTTSGQQGAALVVSLVILLVMTLIGVAAMQSTTMDEKMVGNMRDLGIALQAAEAALREGEAAAWTTDIDDYNFNGSSGTKGKYAEDSTIDVFASSTWTTAKSIEYAGSLHTGPSQGVAAPPRYIQEYLAEIPVKPPFLMGTGYGSSAKRHAIRTISRGNGLTGNTEIFLQSDTIVIR